MSITLASHQPDFFPYMGYFYKLFQSDIFVFSDNVQFSKSGRHNYNTILTANGPRRLTLPIHYHVSNINEICVVSEEKNIVKILKTITQEYRKAPYFNEAYPVFEELFMRAVENPDITLSMFNAPAIMKIASKFGLTKDREFYFASSGLLYTPKRRDERIIDMCKKLGADRYYSGVGAKDYHIEREYEENGIELVYSDYQPVIYPQIGKPPTENMSVIDYVMNCGFNLPEGWKKDE